MRGWGGYPLHCYALNLIYPTFNITPSWLSTAQACLNFLLAKGVSVEEIRADEIHEGNMKAGPHPDNRSDTCFFMTKGEHTF